MLNQVQKLIGLIVIWTLLPIFMLLTNPETLALPLLIIPFIILLVCLYISAFTLMRVFFKQLTPARIKTMATLIALLPTLLFLLASIGQLTIRDTAIILGLLGFLVFYLKRLDFIKNL